jgi:hypothetical protein
MTVNCNSFLTYHDTSLQTDAHQHFEVNRRLNNKTPNPPGTSGSGGPAPPSNSASIQESNVALQKIIASSFKILSRMHFVVFCMKSLKDTKAMQIWR